MSSPGAPTGAPAGESMLVQLSSLDTMLHLAGEVIIVSANLESLNRLIQSSKLPKELSDGAKELAYTSSRISSDLHRLVVDVRNVDLRATFARFRRLVRDTARRLGKVVHFEAEGMDTSLDKRIVERIYDPIAHQLRNCVAHGIESEEVRRARGKDSVGRVTLRVQLLETSIRIVVADDGGGVDVSRVREVAVDRGLMTRGEAASASTERLTGLLFQPGFSTAASTTTTAGRGVGLDVIVDAMRELDGDVKLDSQPGQGTALTLDLPKVSAVNIMDALLVRCERDIFAFPLSSVLSTLAVAPGDLSTAFGGGPFMLYRGETVALHDLQQVFCRPEMRHPPGELWKVLLVEHKEHRIGFVVSEFLRPQKLVITPFEGTLEIAAIAGTAILSGRRLAMIVDVPELLRLARNRGVRGQSEALPRGSRGPAERDGAAPAPETPRGGEPSVEAKTSGMDLRVEEEGAGRDFLRELEGLLSRLNLSLLTLDEKRDRETTDEVFRLAHSIKGNFAMSGQESAASLTHAMEAILDAARQGKQDLVDESFDLLFDGCVHLEQVTAELLAGHRAPETSPALLERIERLTPAKAARLEAVPADGRLRLPPNTQFLMCDRIRRGQEPIELELRFEARDEPAFLVAYLILRRIQRLGDVLASAPTVAEMEAGLCGNALRALVSVAAESGSGLDGLEPYLREHFGVTGFQRTTVR